MLHLYRRLLALRRGSEALQSGGCEVLDTPEGTLGYRRLAAGDERTIVANFTDRAHTLDLGHPLVVELASDATGEQAPFDGELAAERVLLLRKP